MMSRLSLSSFISAVVLACLGHPGASAQDISCDKSPISYDLSGYSSEQKQSCDIRIMSAAEFDESTANEELRAFSTVFMPRDTRIWATQFGGDGMHNGFVNLARTTQPLSLSTEDIHAGIEATVKLPLFSETPGKVEWHGTAEVDGYAVEFYYSEQDGLFGAVASECLALSRYPDGSARSHNTRIIGTYCEAATGMPLDAAKARTAIAMIRYRPELIR